MRLNAFLLTVSSLVCDFSAIAEDPAGLIARNAALEQRVKILEQSTPPIGAVIPFAGISLAEDAKYWMLCDGRILPVPASPTDEYSAIYATIGGTYGLANQDGKNYFRLPDLRGRAAVGKNNMGGTDAGVLTAAGKARSGLDGNVLGSSGGADVHRLTESEMPKHVHEVNDPGHTHSKELKDDNPTKFYTPSGYGRSGNVGNGSNGVSPSTIKKAETGITIKGNGGGDVHNNLQPSIVLNYIIRVR